MKNLSPKQYAHLGDCVWELFVRENVVVHTARLKSLHNLTTAFVNARFQTELLMRLEDFFTEEEKVLIKRGRNITTSSVRKIDQSLHRQASGFEAIVGYLYLNDKTRLNELYEHILNTKALCFSIQSC